jgi:hypothetical protein
MAITELKILKYECGYCLHDWTMINTGKDSRSLDDNGYFCPYCGEKEGEKRATRMPMAAPIKLETEELPRFATDKETDFKETKSTLAMKTATPSIVHKGEKTATRLEAEDRVTQARCTDGGWWNPITKQCQGEGVGHNIAEELDNDPNL